MRHEKEMMVLKRDEEKAKQDAAQQNMMMMMKGIMGGVTMSPPSLPADFSPPRVNTDDEAD